MRFQVFLTGAVIMALGGLALRVLPGKETLQFLNGALTLGGGLVICGLFALKSHWHGIIGAGVLALLGAARGVANVPDLLKFAEGDRHRGPAPLMELGVTLACLFLLIRVLKALQRERTRRMLEEE